MLENYSPQAVKLIEFAESLAESDNKKIIGTEHLLLAMFETEDTICHFLLTEEQITKEELLEEMDLIYNESYQLEHSKFTQKFNDIVSKAKDSLKLFKTKYIYDEHLFYTLLNDNESNATKIIINLGLSPIELIEDIFDIFNIKKEEKNEFDFLTNLTTLDVVHPYIERNNQLEKLNIILNKKQKNNPMLIGNAGVGKTALIEGYAKKYPDVSIYRFELGSVVAGTKYRGELEEKIVKAINYIKEQNAILFIDEIHNIVGAGSNEGTMDISNILKPYISRSDFHCIGATTLDEYYRYIDKDKALVRRFHNIFIDEPRIEEVIDMLEKIKGVYESYHNIKYDSKLIEYVVEKCDKFIVNRTFPDKAIDVLDELGSIVKINNTADDYFEIVDEIIRDFSGIKFEKNIDTISLNYEQIKPYYEKYLKIKEPKSLICSISQKELVIDLLINDLENISSFKKENYLEIDLETYIDSTSLNLLIGSNKGYVGYESGGILSEHLIKFPFSLVYFKNLDKAHLVISNFINKLLKSPYFIDSKGRKISLTNTIIVVEKNKNSNNIVGLFSEKAKDNKNNLFDLVI